MSTELHRQEHTESELVATRFCGPEREGPDRVRVQLMLVDCGGFMVHNLTRAEWAELSWEVNRAFDEMPEKS